MWLLTHCTDEEAKTHSERLNNFLKVISVTQMVGRPWAFFPNQLFSASLVWLPREAGEVELALGKPPCQSGML